MVCTSIEALVANADIASSAPLPGHLRNAVTDYFACVADGWRSDVARRAHDSKVFRSARGSIYAVAANANSYDDIDPVSGAHLSTVALATICEFAEPSTTFSDVSRAYFGSLCIVQNLSHWMGTDIWNRGWHPTPVFGTFAAAYAASAMNRLSQTATGAALSFATSMAAGGHSHVGTDAKVMHSGFAVERGIDAMNFARAGFSSGAEPVLGKGGYLARIAGVEPRRLAMLPVRPTQFKLYPCCAYLFVFIEAAKRIAKNKRGKVVSARCMIPQVGHDFVNRPEPASEFERRHSLQFVVAVVLGTGTIRPEDFRTTFDKREFPITLHVSRSWADAKVEFLDASGEWQEELATHHAGDELHPCTAAEIEEKLGSVSPSLARALNTAWPMTQEPNSALWCRVLTDYLETELG